MSGSARIPWTEALLDGALLGLFMLSASAFAVLFEHPDAGVRARLPDPALRRALMGLAMGATAAALIHCGWGRRSGAHMNPATTLTFLRLGRIAPRHAAPYVAGQFLGGAAGALLASVLLGVRVAHPAVAHVATVPGAAGTGAAFAAELAISFLLMTLVLAVSSRPALARFTGLAAAAFVAAAIAFEAPLSGMSMNPARTVASVLAGGSADALWIYLVAPPAGMLLAAELRVRLSGAPACAKLCHDARRPCLFCEHARETAILRRNGAEILAPRSDVAARGGDAAGMGRGGRAAARRSLAARGGGGV